jgi:hypothetical protein
MDGYLCEVLKVNLTKATVKLRFPNDDHSTLSFDELMRTGYTCVQVRDDSWGSTPFVFPGQETTRDRIKCSRSPYQVVCHLLESGIPLDDIDIDSDPLTALTLLKHDNGISGMHLPLPTQVWLHWQMSYLCMLHLLLCPAAATCGRVTDYCIISVSTLHQPLVSISPSRVQQLGEIHSCS